MFRVSWKQWCAASAFAVAILAGHAPSGSAQQGTITGKGTEDVTLQTYRTVLVQRGMQVRQQGFH